MHKAIFPQNFIWGAATSAYQIEGAVNEDDRGVSIWDVFLHSPHMAGRDHADRACDHYHRFREDIRLMKELGLKGYRFSIAWPRIFPTGSGASNPKGEAFYQSLVDELLANGIEPTANLYHWDLPQKLQEIGGWTNRDVIGYYTDYAAHMYRRLGDRVKQWFTHNEPRVVANLGYAVGTHAPGFMDHSLAVQVSHHLLLSHARAVQAFRQLGPEDGRIGITLNLSPMYPASTSPADTAAAAMADGIHNRWYLGPICKGKYPEETLRLYETKFRAPAIAPGDLDLIAANPSDFLALNYYNRCLVKEAREAAPFGLEMRWEPYPRGLYDLLTRLDRDYGHPAIYVAENGYGNDNEEPADDRVEDDDRIAYLQNHLHEVHRALREGVDIRGYYVWTLLDDFEWRGGYRHRMGLIRVNRRTMARTWKKSAHWYREVIKNNGF
ncbi:MAG: GH1 family beta-glucosidase [Bacteroidota bacterium]